MSPRSARLRPARASQGFTLIELMVAMVLGLIVIGGAVSVLLANRRTYRTAEALSEVQESARNAFELLARDARQAGVSGCDNRAHIANVLNPGIAWWQDWFAMAGYDGADVDPAVETSNAVGDRVAGTDAIQLQGVAGASLAITTHAPAAATFRLNTKADLRDGDVLVACDFDHAAIFQTTRYDSLNRAVLYDAGAGLPGNCSRGLGFPADCSSAEGNVYEFHTNAQLARLAAVDWYVGNSGRDEEGGRSLYRRRLATGAEIVTEEVVAGITDLQIQYHVSGLDGFTDASALSASDWGKVSALAITLATSSSARRVSTDPEVGSGRLQRRFTWVVTLRNRVQ